MLASPFNIALCHIILQCDECNSALHSLFPPERAVSRTLQGELKSQATSPHVLGQSCSSGSSQLNSNELISPRQIAIVDSNTATETIDLCKPAAVRASSSLLPDSPRYPSISDNHITQFGTSAPPTIVAAGAHSHFYNFMMSCIHRPSHVLEKEGYGAR